MLYRLNGWSLLKDAGPIVLAQTCRYEYWSFGVLCTHSRSM